MAGWMDEWVGERTFQVVPSKSWNKARAVRLEAKKNNNKPVTSGWPKSERPCDFLPHLCVWMDGLVIYNPLPPPHISKSEDVDCRLSEGTEQPPAGS